MCTSVSRYDILVPHQGLDHYEKAIEEGRMTLDDVRLAIQVNRSRSSHETSLHYQPSALCASVSVIPGGCPPSDARDCEMCALSQALSLTRVCALSHSRPRLLPLARIMRSPTRSHHVMIPLSPTSCADPEYRRNTVCRTLPNRWSTSSKGRCERPGSASR